MSEEVKRKVLSYLLIIAILIAFGLPTRTTENFLPDWYVDYIADGLWAMMLYFIFRLFFTKLKFFGAFILTMTFTWSIEFSQFYHAPWIDHLRGIKFFGLILGYGFLYSDLVAYTLGISTGVLIDKFLIRSNTGSY